MTIVGLVIILGVFMAYLAMLFVFHRFTYKTWIFDVAVGTGMVMSAWSWFQEGGSWLSGSTLALGAMWFLVSRTELRLVGSKELYLRVGDKLPAMTFLKTDGTQFTEHDLTANGPALLTLYRGWWCPSSKVQLDEIIGKYRDLKKKGVSVFAASVDEPNEAAPIQEHVGNDIIILCSVPEEILSRYGVLDTKGAPWYDRIILGAPKRPIAMPATLVINKDGIILFASRSTRVDDGPRVDDILASLAVLP